MAIEAVAVVRGSVVLVRVHGDKARPAVVIRSDLLSMLTYATILPITSDLRENVSLRIDIAPSATNGLRVASQVMADWPQTVRFSDIGAVIGRLDAVTMREITRQAAIVLGIGSPVRSRR
jgi:mRNA interferase MazF